MEEHVETWRLLNDSIEGHKWQMSAIAESLYQRFGTDAIREFAGLAGTSERRVEEYAKTYREWKGRERSRILSFHHHTIAARSPDPEAAIQVAEDEHLSTRELERYIQREARVEAGQDPEPELETCPMCKGAGVVEAKPEVDSDSAV